MSTALTPYLTLGKFRLSLLVVFTAAVGYALGTDGLYPIPLVALIVGTLLCAMGANGLNQWWERDKDARMQRTSKRPIPSGVLSPKRAFSIALSWLILGCVVMALLVNWQSAALAALTAIVYLFAYTPLKTRTAISVLVGAIPGAIPPVMGWVAATGELSPEGWVLGCLLYLWQIPHFMSLASLLRDDYQQGGFRLLPDDPVKEQNTRAIILVFSVALLCISMLAPLIGVGKIGFIMAAILCGGLMLRHSILLYRQYSTSTARQLFLGSILYLPATMTLLIFEQKLLPFFTQL